MPLVSCPPGRPSGSHAACAGVGAGMTLVVELRRGGSVSRAGRTSGPRPSVGMLERLVDDNDEFWTAVERLGRHRVRSLARIDPYGDTPFSGD